MVTTTRLRRFVHTVAIGAVVVLGALPPPASGGGRELLFVFMGMAALAGIYPICFAGSGIRLTMTHPVILAALVVLGPRPAVWVALAGVAGSTLVRAGLRGPFRVLFNFSETVISTGAAGWVYLRLGFPGAGPIDAALPLLVAGAAYFFVNTLLVAGVVACEHGQSSIAVWRRSFGWTMPAFFAAVALAPGILFLLGELGPWAIALALPPCWLLAAFYRMHERSLEEEERRNRQVEALNAGLHDALARVRTLERRTRTEEEDVEVELRG